MQRTAIRDPFVTLIHNPMKSTTLCGFIECGECAGPRRAAGRAGGLLDQVHYLIACGVMDHVPNARH